MEKKEHVNPFADVHKKAELLKERARQEHLNDEEIRKKRLLEQAKSALEGKPV